MSRKNLLSSISNNPLIFSSAFVAVGLVCVFWLKTHVQRGAYSTLFTQDVSLIFHTLLPLLAFLGILTFTYLYIRIRHGIQTTVQYRWIYLIAALVAWSVLAFTLTMYLRVIPPYPASYLDPNKWLQHQFSIWPKTISQLGWMFIFTGVTYLLGLRMYTICIKRPLRTLRHHLEALVFGLIGVTGIVFVLGVTHILTREVLLILAVLIVLSFYKILPSLLKQTYKKHSVTINVHTITPWIWSILFFLLSLALVDSILPDPSGFDSSTDYLNKAHLMAQEGSLIPGGKPFAYGILATVGYLFHSTAVFAIGINVVYAVLGFLAVYGFTQTITKDTHISLLSSSLFATLPVTSVFISRDIKTDLLLFFIMTMAVWALYIWLTNKQKVRHLYISALFFGFALSVKLTAAFMIIPLGTYLAFLFFSKQWGLHYKEKIKVLVLSALFLLIPMIPWIGLKLATTPELNSKATYIDALSSYNELEPKFDDATLLSIGIDPSTCGYTGFEEDVSRFGAHVNTWSDTLILPWKMTMNTVSTQVQADMTEIGFVFLISVLLSVLLFRYIKKESHEVYPQETRSALIVLLGMSIVYWLIWYVTSNLIVWYAYPGLLLFIILSAILLHTFKKHSLLYKIVLGAILLQLALFTCIRLTYFAPPYSAAYIGEGVEIRDRTYQDSTNILNKDLSTRIYMTAVPMIYHIENNDTRLLRDYYLDGFACVDAENDDSLTLSRLQQLDIDYIVYNKRLSELLPSTFKNKLSRFLEFSNTNLPKALDAKNVTIYEVPKETAADEL